MHSHSQPPLTTTSEAVHSGGRKWADLLPEILIGLLKYIDLRTDLPRLRSVCPSWRSVLSPARFTSLPPKVAAPPLPTLKHQLLLSMSGYYLFRPLHNPGPPWLARLADIGPSSWKVVSPFGFHSYFFPEPPIIAELNLLDCVALCLSSPWFLFKCSGTHTKATTFSKKVVGGWALNSRYVFAVLVLIEKAFGGGFYYLNLADYKWVPVEIDNVADIVYYDGKFYVFDEKTWRVGVINPNYTFSGTKTIKFFPGPSEVVGVSDVTGVHFVPAKEGLYLVVEAGEKGTVVMVFVLNEGKCEWERVRSIGDQIFFVGYDVSFAVSASETLPEWKRGSICLFTKRPAMVHDGFAKGLLRFPMPKGTDCLDQIQFPQYWRYLRMYNVEEEEKGIVPFKDLSKEVYTGLFFPPPPWIKWSCPQLGDAEVKLDGLRFEDDKLYAQFEDLPCSSPDSIDALLELMEKMDCFPGKPGAGCLMFNKFRN